MITVSKAAAAQIRHSMEETGAEGMSLRIAARRLEDGRLDYAMGFDGTDHNDSHHRSNGIDIVVAPTSTELLRDAILDYVELEKGDFQFIFVNPNDPLQTAPEKDYLDQVSGDAGSGRKGKAPGKGVIPDQAELKTGKGSRLPGFKPA